MILIESDWNDKETAPKDGRVFMALLPSGEQSLCCFVENLYFSEFCTEITAWRDYVPSRDNAVIKEREKRLIYDKSKV